MEFKLSNLQRAIMLGDENYKKFKNYGFTFKKGYCEGNVLVKEKKVSVNNIQDLMKIIKYFECSIIVDEDSITIYDSYNE